MRSPRVRFTVRRLMVATAIVAVIFRGIQLRRRSVDYAANARYYEMREDSAKALHRYTAMLFPGRPVESIRRFEFGLVGITTERDGAHLVKIEEYYGRKAALYRRAARYPWLPVAPDPPEPK